MTNINRIYATGIVFGPHTLRGDDIPSHDQSDRRILKVVK